MKNVTPFIIGALLCLNFSALSASNFKIVNQRLSQENSKIPTYIEFDEANRPGASEIQEVFKNYYKSVAEFSFKEIGRETDQLGFLHIRYEQTYQGYEIELAEVIAHIKNEKIYSVNGKLIDEAPVSNPIVLSESEALQNAKNYIGASSYKWESADEEMHLKFETSNPAATYFPTAELKYISPNVELNPADLRLAYKFNIYAQEPLSRQHIYIDVETGEVLFTNNLIHTADVQGTAVTAYSGNQTITTDSVSANLYRLRENGRGNGVLTFDLQRGTSYANAVDFTDSDNFWNNVNTLRDQYATDAHWGSESTYDYYFTKYNRNSINDNGFALISYLHYATNFNNAFWDGQRMTYGDGSGSSTPLVALDIAGHEVSHGLTTFTANLIYADESGALNESFSDIFGTAIEFFARPSRANWTIGEDIGNAFRSMSNPNSYFDPDTYDGTHWKATALTGGCTPTNGNDQCGVHSNSGVQNFWFYLLSSGGSGSNDNGDSYSVTGITMDKAAAIAYRNLTVYLTQSSNFDDARFYSIQSAVDLYGACSPEYISTVNAWYAVGVGPAYTPGVVADFTADFTASCAPPMRTSFTNLSKNATDFTWFFGDGSGSLQRSPSNNYTSYGQFDVKLIADGGACGIDSITKVAFIDIDTNNACTVTLNDGANPTQLECTGKLYDSGGPSGNYSNNENATITISPANASSVTLNFISFDVEAGQAGSCNFDYMQIFDGASTSSPSMGVFCNNNLPTTLTSTGGSITIQFISDPGLTLTGFEIDWQCNYPSSPPVANFTALSTASCDGEIEFNDISGQAPNSWFWDFGDGNSSNQQNPVYTYTTNGSFDVQLIVSNAFGADTVTKTNYITINRPTRPVVTNDTVCIGQTANLSATAGGTMKWYAEEFGGNPVVNGNNFTLNNVMTDTTVWAENYINAPISTVGPFSNSIGSGTYFNGDQHLIFDVFDKIELVSVKVFTNSSANRTIELRDNNGVVLQSYTRYIPASPNGFRVTLNFTIDPGNNYQLGIPSGGQSGFYRNNGGVSYPYNISNKISIKTSSAGANPGSFYYFFYNWRVKSPDCVSARIPATAKVDTSCNVTGLDKAVSSEGFISLFPNPAKNKLTIQATHIQKIKSVRLMDITGKSVYEHQFNVLENKVNLDLNNFVSGVYFVTINTMNEVYTGKVIISK